MFCPKCGAQNDDTARFCIKCGQSLAVALPPTPAPRQPSRLGRALLISLAVLVLLGAVGAGIYFVVQQMAPAGGWIAYQTQAPDDTLSLWVVRPDGRKPIELVEGAGTISYSRVQVRKGVWGYVRSPFSLAGDRMVFQVEWPLPPTPAGGESAQETEADKAVLYTHVLGQDEPEILVSTAGRLSFDLSPNGHWVGYGLEEEGEASFHIVDTDGKNRVTLISHADDVWWDLSPDGRRILYDVEIDDQHSLYLADVDGENRVALAQNIDDVIGRFSEKGDQRAYAVLEGGRWAVYTVGADGQDPVSLAGGLNDVNLYEFSPDADRLILNTSTDGYSYDLYIVETDGQGRLTLASNVEQARGWFLPDGKRIAFGVEKGDQWGLYLVDADGGEQTTLARKVDGFRSALTPDGRTFILGWRKRGAWDLYAVDVATGEQVRLLRNADELGKPIPLDNRRVLFAAREGDRWYLYVAPLDGEEKVTLAGPVDEFRGYDASPDGRRVVYSEVNLGVSTLYLIDADGRHKEKLADGGFKPVWSR